MKYFFITITALLLAIESGYACSIHVSGRVLDSSGSVVPGVHVTLVDQNGGQQWSTVTNDIGHFIFCKRRPGYYLVRVKSPGFQSLTQEIVIYDVSVEIDLILSVVEITAEVVVSASGNPQLTSQTARTSFVLNEEALEVKKKIFLGEALLGHPSLRVQRLGGFGNFINIRFRGLREVDTGLLFNGHRIRDAAGFRGGATFFLGEMMLTNLSRIEIIPGASSQLYGSSASGGVINLVPKFGVGNPSFQASFEGGALGLLREQFLSTGEFTEGLHYSLGIIRTDVNDGLDGQDVYRNTAVNSTLNWNLHPDIVLSGMLYYSGTPHLDLNESPFPIGPPGNELGFEQNEGPVTGFIHNLNDPDSRRKSHLMTGILSWQHQINNAWNYSLYYQNTNTNLDFSDGPMQHSLLSDLGVAEFPFESSRTKGLIHVMGTKHHLRIGKHHLFLFGFEHERESRGSKFTPCCASTLEPEDYDRQNSTAFFIHDQIALFDHRLQLLPSFRAQFFSIDNPKNIPEVEGLQTPSAYTGGLAISYLFPNTGTKIRVQAANGFRAPSLSERFADLETSAGRIRIGNPLLRPERTLTTDFGFDQVFMNNRLRIGATYFYNRLQEIIVSTTLFKQTNTKGGLSRGFELSAESIPLKNVSLSGSYTYTNADFIPPTDVLRFDNNIALGGIARSTEGIPHHQWSAGFRFRQGLWDFNLQYLGINHYEELLFSPRFFRQVLFKLDGYQRVDAGVIYTLATGEHSSIKFYLRGENIFNNHYFEDGFQAHGAEVWIGIDYHYR